MFEQLCFSGAFITGSCFFNGTDAALTIDFFHEDISVPFSPKMTDHLDALAQLNAVQMEQRDAD